MNNLNTLRAKKSYLGEQFLSSFSYSNNDGAATWVIDNDWDEDLLNQLPRSIPELSSKDQYPQLPQSPSKQSSSHYWLLKVKENGNIGLPPISVFSHLELKSAVYQSGDLQLLIIAGQVDDNYLNYLHALISAIFVSINLDYLNISIKSKVMEKNFSNSLEKLDSNPRTDNDSETHPIIKRVYKPVSIWKALKSETLAISLSASSLFCIERSWWCDRPENKKYMESFSYLARRTESYLKQLDAPRKKRKRPLIARLFFPKID